MMAKLVTGLVLYVEYASQSWPWKKRVGPLTEDEEGVPAQGWPHADAILVGFAMVARGEIGFLIASLSQNSGTLVLERRDQIAGEEKAGEVGEDASLDLFLVIIWSVVLCTVVGPVAVGVITRKQRTRRNGHTQGSGNVLWSE